MPDYPTEAEPRLGCVAFPPFCDKRRVAVAGVEVGIQLAQVQRQVAGDVRAVHHGADAALGTADQIVSTTSSGSSTAAGTSVRT
jgi:hypothetical protein